MHVTSAESSVTTESDELIVNGDFSTQSYWTKSSNATYDKDNKCFQITKNGGYIISTISTDNSKQNLVSKVKQGFYKISFKMWKSEEKDAAITVLFAIKSTNVETIVKEFTIEVSKNKPAFSSCFYFYKSSQEDYLQLKIKSTTQECSSIYIDDISLVQITTPIETETGASIRSSITDSGLRFKGNINKGVYDYLVTTYGESNVEVGMLLAPTDLITDIEDFTIENLDDRIKYKKIIAERSRYFNKKRFRTIYNRLCRKK